MSTTAVPIDDELLAILGGDGADPARALQEAAVLDLYRRAVVSAGWAADLLGMARWDFVRWAGEQGLTYMDITPEELAQDVERIEALLER